MSLEAIRQVTQAEAAAKQRKADAADSAKKIIADAHLAGEEALRSTVATANAHVKQIMLQAEEHAARRAEELASQSKADCAALCSAAESKLDEAAALIVRRVVNS